MHNCQFKAPVYAGNTLTTPWIVTGKVPKPKTHARIFLLSGSCVHQDGVPIAPAEGKIVLFFTLLSQSSQ